MDYVGFVLLNPLPSIVTFVKLKGESQVKKNRPTRIVELHLHRSKKTPSLCHVVAILFPCNHRKYLGITKTPEGMEGKFKRADNVKIWTPTVYVITDKESCNSCPSDNYWIHDLPRLEELNEIKDEEFFN